MTCHEVSASSLGAREDGSPSGGPQVEIVDNMKVSQNWETPKWIGLLQIINDYDWMV